MIKKSVVMNVKFSGDVSQSDYEQMTPEVKALVEAQGNICMLLDMTDFHWEKAKAWKSDLDFGKEFGQKIDKMAIVGKKQWMSWMTKLADSHYARQAKYFDADSISSAWEWLRQ